MTLTERDTARFVFVIVNRDGDVVCRGDGRDAIYFDRLAAEHDIARWNRTLHPDHALRLMTYRREDGDA